MYGSHAIRSIVDFVELQKIINLEPFVLTSYWIRPDISGFPTGNEVGT